MPFNNTLPSFGALSLCEDELLCNRLLVDVIRQKIRARDTHSITFSEFMNLALYHPDYGYYTSDREIFGESGDFTTASEMGDLFGTVLAMKISHLFEYNQLPKRIYEFGAGSGRLACLLLNELDRLGQPADEYMIYEISPKLRDQQQRTLNGERSDFSTEVRWSSEFDGEELAGVVIANEMLDALPVEIFRIENQRTQQGYVVADGNQLAMEFCDELHPEFIDAFNSVDIDLLDDGYTSELHCFANAWISQIASALTAGSILIFDYGFPECEYYHPDRRQGTLIGHRRHHTIHNPLDLAGCQDLSAHLNFSGLARQAVADGLKVNGFATLGGFLINAGITDLNITRSSQVVSQQLAREFNTLTSAAEMGEIFKVLELAHNIEPSNFGFQNYDRVHYL